MKTSASNGAEVFFVPQKKNFKKSLHIQKTLYFCHIKIISK